MKEYIAPETLPTTISIILTSSVQLHCAIESHSMIAVTIHSFISMGQGRGVLTNEEEGKITDLRICLNHQCMYKRGPPIREAPFGTIWDCQPVKHLGTSSCRGESTPGGRGLGFRRCSEGAAVHTHLLVDPSTFHLWCSCDTMDRSSGKKWSG